MARQCKKIFLVGLTIVLCPFMWQISNAYFQDEALFLRHTDNGLIVVRQEGLPNTGGSSMLDNPVVVWSHNLTDATYNTTSNTVDGYVFAGTYLNPPMETELFALTGGGIPEWGYGGTEFYTDAGDGVFTLAAVDEDASGVNIIKWTGPGDGTPDWTTSFAGHGVTSYGPIAVSDDGSTIAVIAAPPGTDAHLLLFDADSSIPLADYVASGLGFPRYVKINADGRYTAFIALATIVVFDRDSLNVRDQISMGASNSALDISGDGNIIAYGWPSLQLMEWNGSSYQGLWSWNPGGGYYVNRIAISTDGSTIVSCWYMTSFTTLKVVVHNIGSSTPLWTYDYPTSSGTYQESTHDVDITDDGAYFIVGSLGDAENLNPEVHIFQRDDTPYVYYTVDMPGSVFSVDICSDGSYATACGKHVHTNEMGRGGDIVMINTELIGISGDGFANLLSQFEPIGIYPNPFRDKVDIRWQPTPPGGAKSGTPETVVSRQYAAPSPSDESPRSADGKGSIKIFDITGRLVKQWDHTTIQQANHISWDGRDEQKRQLPGGVYFVQLETPNHNATKKAILLR